MTECIFCNNTGKYKEPLDKEAFDRAFDRYDTNSPSLDISYKRAIDEVGYTIVPCSCIKGKKYAETLK